MTTTVHHRALAHRPRSSRRVGRAWAALLLTASSTLGGCYTNLPVAGVPAPGSTLVLDLTDRGRVALSDSVGPSANRIEGVAAAGGSDSSYALRVSSVQFLNGQTNRWNGEPLNVRADLVGRAQERRFSRGRTYGLAALVVAAIVTVIVTTDLFVAGDAIPDPGTPPPDGQQ